MKIRKYIWSICLLVGLQVLQAAEKPESDYSLIGSYAPAASEGLALYRLNQETAEVERVSGLAGILNPSFLTPNPEKGLVYVVGEGDTDANSTVHTVSLDEQTGTMQLVNTLPTLGASPCHVRLSPSGKYLITANYNGGSLSLFSLDEKGCIHAREEVLRFEGKGPNKERQEKSHLHYSIFSPDGNYLLADDLGTDKVYSFPVHENAPYIQQAERIDNPVRPGSGPRHLCFHPNGKWAYLINELSGAVIFFTYQEGHLKEKQSVQADEVGAQGSADIHLSPDGRFLYASNRLQNDGIAIFSVSEATGELTKVAYQQTGRHPRNFMITPNGRFLLVACRDDNEVQIYERDLQTGKLQDTKKRIRMSQPVCLQLYIGNK